MEDIARQGGISKKTIYQEFADKKDLVKETIELILEADRKKLNEILESEDGVIEHLVNMSKTVRERLQNMNPVVVFEVQKYFPEAWKIFEDFKVEVIMEDLVSVIEKGKKLGYFRPEIDSQILAKARINQISSMFEPENSSKSSLNLADEQTVLLDHFLHGIFTEEGRSAYTTLKAIDE
ncbi:TetR/AcrR family transcriptional regulator [Algoriphagus jejuensis]|uniref:TetR/AcrR family transcriptional regulator n=2 Tax=Algoriphagus jejuensis TaxID=419934 RepID=A0ABP3YH20_9BACT